MSGLTAADAADADADVAVAGIDAEAEAAADVAASASGVALPVSTGIGGGLVSVGFDCSRSTSIGAALSSAIDSAPDCANNKNKFLSTNQNALIFI